MEGQLVFFSSQISFEKKLILVSDRLFSFFFVFQLSQQGNICSCKFCEKLNNRKKKRNNNFHCGRYFANRPTRKKGEQCVDGR